MKYKNKEIYRLRVELRLRENVLEMGVIVFFVVFFVNLSVFVMIEVLLVVRFLFFLVY